MEHFMIIVNGWKLLTIIKRNSILDVVAVLDPHLEILNLLYALVFSLVKDALLDII